MTVTWPPRGDEPGFLLIARDFGAQLDAELLRTYRAMPGPLAFLAYAAWGHVAGFATWQLRLLSPILAVATCAVLADSLERYGVNKAGRAIALATLCLNPYFVGVGVRVYTDMLSLLLLAIMIAGVARRRAWLVAIGAGGAALTRQYALFAAAAFLAATVWIRRSNREVWSMRAALGIVMALLPLGALYWLWHGPAPVSDLREMYLSEPFRFHPAWLSLYLAAPGLYAAPFVVWSLIRRRPAAGSIAIGAAVALSTIAFPIQSSAFQAADCCPDTGYAHRALLRTGHPWLVQAVWLLASVAWLAPAVERLRATVRRWRAVESPDVADLFPWLALAGFLALMPFSYMPWEKYVLPELFFVFLVLRDPRPPISRE